MSLSLTAIVVTHDSAAVLPECLSAFRRADVPVVVVDNASGDDTVKVAEDYGAIVIRNGRNEGYGRANNCGVRAAASDYVLIANPDLVLADGAIAALEAATRHYPEAGLYAPRILEHDGRVFFQPRSLLATYLTNPSGRSWLPAGDVCAPFFSGACFVMRRDVFLALGGFDENIFLFYEDDDLCRRLADSGKSLVWVHEAIVRHGRGRSSSPKRGRAFRMRWHQAWSKAYVSRKYGLKSPALPMLAVNVLKAFGALCLFNRKRRERYSGSAAGSLAWLLGRNALKREGLE